MFGVVCLGCLFGCRAGFYFSVWFAGFVGLDDLVLMVVSFTGGWALVDSAARFSWVGCLCCLFLVAYCGCGY